MGVRVFFDEFAGAGEFASFPEAEDGHRVSGGRGIIRFTEFFEASDSATFSCIAECPESPASMITGQSWIFARGLVESFFEQNLNRRELLGVHWDGVVCVRMQSMIRQRFVNNRFILKWQSIV
jgi:hypothetical protein